MNRSLVNFFITFYFLMLDVETFATVVDREEAATVGFGLRTEGVATFVVVAEVHGHKDTGFYPFYELEGATHVVTAHPTVYGEEGHIDGRRFLLQVADFGQVVAFGLANFLRSGFLAPVPVVQVAGMEEADALHVE